MIRSNWHAKRVRHIRIPATSFQRINRQPNQRRKKKMMMKNKQDPTDRCTSPLIMDATNLRLAEQIVNAAYIRQGEVALRQRETSIRILLSQRKLPQEGWNDAAIEMLLHELALMDSNNFPENIGLGEREARFASRLVASRHYRLGHGVGRSGELAAVQPKAAGSSLMAKLAEYFVAEALQLAGVSKLITKGCLLLPLATGMSLTLTLLALKQRRPISATHVLWPRIDQKSCLKAIVTAGFIPVVVPNLLDNDKVCTNIEWIDNYLKTNGADTVLCVLTTTSCFAPRVPDKIVEVAQLCKQYGVGHIVNNAYGVQSSKCMHMLGEAARLGRLDAYVQSMDKNFLVPVGGAIVAGPDSEFIEAISQSYPGRASNGPLIDIFITLLSLGSDGYRQLLKDRKERYVQLKQALIDVGAKHGLRLLDTPANDVSLALSLEGLGSGSNTQDLSFIGSMLFSRSVSGTRVVTLGSSKTIGEHKFNGFMTHIDNYPVPYLTAAAALGVTAEEITTFAERLDRVLTEFKKTSRLK